MFELRLYVQYFRVKSILSAFLPGVWWLGYQLPRSSHDSEGDRVGDIAQHGLRPAAMHSLVLPGAPFGGVVLLEGNR